MPIDVRVSLRVPSLTVRPADAPVQRIDNQSLRFTKRIAVPAIPQTGDRLQLTARFIEPFDTTVTRADWNEEHAMFVVACSYAKRSIAQADYDALINDPDWTTVQLP
jgi:hypothetical protein